MTTPVPGVLPPGAKAPVFTLPTVGGEKVAVPAGPAGGLTLIAFYKYTCPTCRLAMPYLQRLHEQVGPAGGRVVAVSQDGPEDAGSFARQLGLTMTVAVDGPGYPVSNAYDLVAVPTIYLLAADGTVAQSFAGFHKANLQQMAEALAASLGAAPPLLYHEGEQLPEFKPG